jgi:hypothetical protein
MKAKPSAPTPSKNQGEGDTEAARRYNEDQKQFVESGAVNDAARRAAPRSDQEASELLQAEQAGRRKAKGEDPTVPGANAQPKTKSKVRRSV